MKRIFTILLVSHLFIAGLFSQTITRVGNDNDISTNHQQGFLMMGGGGDNYDGLDWLYALAQGGDVVILRHNAGLGYNDDYNNSSVNTNSFTTIENINSVQAANSDEVEEVVRNAEAVFIAGGNQAIYYEEWKGTKLHDALMYLIHEKQVAVGGTSAGMAILGEIVFTALNSTIFSSEALQNPYHFRMTLADDFLDIPILQNLVTDSHYDRVENDNQNRHGRHIGFMSRMVHDWNMGNAKGIGVDEYTALGIESNGIARVFGNPNYDDYVYFLQAVSHPEIIEDNTPLTWYNDENAVFVYKVKGDRDGSRTFDLNDWRTGHDGSWHKWFVQAGELHKTHATEEEILEFLGSLQATDASGFSTSMYPNPARNHFTIQSENPIHSLIIRNSLGQEVRHVSSLQQNKVKIDTQYLPEGLYFIELHYSGGGREIKKLMVGK